MSGIYFEYRFECDACAQEWEPYSFLSFPDLFDGRLILPIIDLELRAFGRLVLDLSVQQRKAISGDKRTDALIEIASRWSAADRIVVVPLAMRAGAGERGDVTCWPDPLPCPLCHSPLRGRPC